MYRLVTALPLQKTKNFAIFCMEINEWLNEQLHWFNINYQLVNKSCTAHMNMNDWISDWSFIYCYHTTTTTTETWNSHLICWMASIFLATIFYPNIECCEKSEKKMCEIQKRINHSKVNSFWRSAGAVILNIFQFHTFESEQFAIQRMKTPGHKIPSTLSSNI